MRIGLKIGEHDLKVKLDKVNNFLEAGHKVKLTVFFRGREMAHKELGFKMADRVIEKLGDKVVVEQAPNLAGNQLHFVVRSSSHAKA